MRLFTMILFFFPVLANAGFYDRRAEGWFWYEDKTKQQEQDEQEQNSITPEIAEKTLKQEKKKLKGLLRMALMAPTPNNVRNYILLQNKMVDRSLRLSEVWRWVVYNNRDLDPEVNFPTSHLAREVYQSQEDLHRTEVIKTMSKTYGLFYFFSGNCKYCHAFAPIVKSFADKYGWAVFAISIDGGTLPEFPQAQMNNGTAELLGIEGTPTLVAVNSVTQEVIPIAFSMTSEADLEHRIYYTLKMR